MPDIDLRGHTIPAAADAPSRAGLIAMLAGVRDPVVVANATARDVAAAAMSPSTSNPVFVWREDAADGYQLEVSTDGLAWRTLISTVPRTTWVPVIKNGTGTTISSTPTTGACWYYVQGEMAHVHAEVLVNALAAQATCVLPVTAAQRFFGGTSSVTGSGAPASQLGQGYMSNATTLVVAALSAAYLDIPAANYWRFDLSYPIA